MRGFGFTAAMVAMMAVSACDKAPAAAVAPTQVAEADPQPSDTMKESFTGCTWGKVEGATLSIWSYGCPQSSNTHLVADDSLPGFAIEGTYDGQTSRRPTIVAFKKAADAPVSAIVPAVLAKSPGPHSAECVMTPVVREGLPEGLYSFEPVGAAKTAWDAFSSGAEDAAPVDAPCGDLGPQMSGDHVFMVMKDDPTTVVFVDFGSEIQIFDIDTLRSRTAS